MSLRPPKSYNMHKVPKKREPQAQKKSLNLRKQKVLWTQHQGFNEPQAQKIKLT